MHTETEKKESSALRDLSKKAGRFCGKVAKFEDRERAEEEDGVAVKVVGNLVKGISAVSDIAVKLAKSSFVKKEETPAPAEEAVEEEAAAEAPEEETVAEEAVEEEAVAEAPEEEAAEEPEPEKYSRYELEKKTKTQLMELAKKLDVPDAALWRPKDDLVDRILAKQGKNEEESD